MKKLFLFWLLTAYVFICYGNVINDADLTTDYIVPSKKAKCFFECEGDSLYSISFFSSGKSPQFDPTSILIKGSADGKKWKKIIGCNEVKFYSRYQEYIIALPMASGFKKIAIELDNQNNDSVSIAEVQLNYTDRAQRWMNFKYPQVNFVDEAKTTKGSAIYRDLVQMPNEYISYHAKKVAEILFYSDKDIMNDVQEINYHLKEYNGISGKSGCPPSITILYSTTHIERSANTSLYKLDYETRGVLYHELVHAYQFEPKGCGTYSSNKTFWACVEGLADAVRTEAGFFDIDKLRRPGGYWMDGYKTTGFFIHWLKTKNPDAIRKFHESVRDLEVWSFEEAIRYMFGKDTSVQVLWDEYQLFLRNKYS